MYHISNTCITFTLSQDSISFKNRTLEKPKLFSFSLTFLPRRERSQLHHSSIHFQQCIGRQAIHDILTCLHLSDNATPDQMDDFKEEITLMKAVGSHKNIVSLIGCCTKSTPNFLIVEFASKGDLLSYLRERRKKVTL